MTAIIIGILCILLVCQILKTILKTSIINKNKIDYVLEYIFSIIIFVTMLVSNYILSVIAKSFYINYNGISFYNIFNKPFNLDLIL